MTALVRGVVLYLAAGSQIKKKFEEACPSDLLPRVTQKITTWNTAPKRAHLVLTTTQLSSALERWSAGRWAMPLVLPEGGVYLAQKVINHLDSGEDLVLLDAALMKVKVA